MTSHRTTWNEDGQRQLVGNVDPERLTELARRLVDVPSPTGSELAVAECIRDACEAIGLDVAWQEVEAERPNVLATLKGSGEGKTLMFNGHMDTSYSGEEEHLRGRPGFQPHASVRDGHIWGLGIANMKGAIACYLEAVRALQDSGIKLLGDVMVAAVVGEIEKAQWGTEFRGAAYRGYSAGTHYLVGHGGVADVCVLGEPTEQRVVLGHYGTLWGRISTTDRLSTRHSPMTCSVRTRSCAWLSSSARSARGSIRGRNVPLMEIVRESSTSVPCAAGIPGG
jgi:acetylornithine deacetylase/succinyl-diaminopimelate desuccinylase-like protein